MNLEGFVAATGVMIDGELERLLDSPGYHSTDTVPIVVRCSAAEFDHLVADIRRRAGGEVRVVPEIRIVAAQVTLSDVRDLARMAGVAVLELDRRLMIR